LSHRRSAWTWRPVAKLARAGTQMGEGITAWVKRWPRAASASLVVLDFPVHSLSNCLKNGVRAPDGFSLIIEARARSSWKSLDERSSHSGMPTEYGHPARKKSITPGRSKYKPDPLVRYPDLIEIGTAPFCCSPNLFPLRPALVAGSGRWPSSCIVPIQPDKIDETLSPPAQSIIQSIGSTDKTPRGVFDRQIRVVSIGPKNIVIGNVLATLDGIAVEATEQKIGPFEFPVRTNALRSDMLQRQVGRQTPLAVAAIATQPVYQVIDCIAALGIGAWREATINRPHLDLSVFLASAFSLRIAPTPGFAE